MLRTLLVGAAIAAVTVLLAACGGSSKSSGSDQATQREADLYELDQVERTWHKATSTKNLELMMSIWAPNATFTFGGNTYSGKAEIRKAFAGAGPFQPQNNWVSETPAYKIRVTVNGDKGTLYFECHYVDMNTQQVVNVVGADQNMQKIDGKWLITSSSAASVTLRR